MADLEAAEPRNEDGRCEPCVYSEKIGRDPSEADCTADGEEQGKECKMKCRIPPRPMSAEEEERYNKRCIRENDKIMHYADHLQVLSLRENLGFGYKRLGQYNDGAYELGAWYIERYTGENEHDDSYAVTSYYAIMRDLIADGWDPEEHLWKDDVFLAFPADKNSAQARREHEARAEYARKISFYVREMYCMSAKWLHDERGFGAERLNRVLAPAADGYLALMRQYMRCSLAGDTEMCRMIAETDKRYREMEVFKDRK